MAITDTSTFKQSDEVMLNTQYIQDMITKLEEAILILGRCSALITAAKDNDAQWEGEGKKYYLTLHDFLNLYCKDILPAYQDYLKAIKLLNTELGEVEG
ncbi:MAG: hypothetical protein ACRCTA_00270 [Bacilli bacterium]